MGSVVKWFRFVVLKGTKTSYIQQPMTIECVTSYFIISISIARLTKNVSQYVNVAMELTRTSQDSIIRCFIDYTGVSDIC